ncbi:DNA-3-methyladenine glycosylase [Pollutibacter soli]|uniref:DNA-3-methyladenine glycosylase n=1 Tax=Pollutibacter soli TaxID=3034157 RepID=UPI0030133105
MKKLDAGFYQRADLLQISKDLLGKLIVTNWDGEKTIARIVETEAYEGIGDKAAHSYGDRRTSRTEVMYNAGGLAYVYLCYGIHHLFNVVTNSAGIPHVVLIRAVEPVEGLTYMAKRIGRNDHVHRLGAGPGKLTKALGISVQHTGISLTGNKIYLADDGYKLMQNEIVASPRIGVDYAGDHALWPYRFMIKDHLSISVKTKSISNLEIS